MPARFQNVRRCIRIEIKLWHGIVSKGYNEYNEILRLNLEEYEWEVLEGENLQMQRGSAAAFIVDASAFPEC